MLIHPDFNQTISEVYKKNIKLPTFPENKSFDFTNQFYPPNGNKVIPLEEEEKYMLDAKKGSNINDQYNIYAYDESINKYNALEGLAYLTSHSLIYMSDYDYVPINLLTFYFYTRASMLLDSSQKLRYSDMPEIQAKKDYIKDKLQFLDDNVNISRCYESLLLIDGPLIGGDVYTTVIGKIKKFVQKGILPIFFVKNSNSNLVTDHIKEYASKYNSDLHWSYSLLNTGERTSLFKYEDSYNPQNAKIFTYIKPFNISPQRVEFPKEVYEKYRQILPDLLDLIYYYCLVQGDIKNPQIRPIAIAESFARSTIHLINFEKLMHESQLTPTMNQNRGFG